MTNHTPPCRPGAQTIAPALRAWLLVLLLSGLWDTRAADAVTGDQALQRLVEGNQRSVAGSWTHPHQSLERRADLTKGQAPFAVILACADSRVSPEVLFDQGLGDLFVVRVAGNVIDNLGLGSLEYAAEHLHTPLMVVLGHTQCGAVQAAVAGGHAPGHIHSLVKALEPAVQKAKGMAGDAVENTVRANVRAVVKQIQDAEPLLRELVKERRLKIVGAVYHLDTGLMELLP